MNDGAIFDWDGVVIDSSAQHERAWEWLAADESLSLPADHFKRGFGKKNEVIIPDLGWATEPAAVARLAWEKEERYRELVRREGVTILPGARELLAALGEAGVPCVVGSSTPRGNIEAIFAATGLGAFFLAVVAAEDVVHGKPAPDVFLEAARRIGREPARCVVFEDAFVGLEAARAGGMRRVAVATTNPLEALRGHADRVVASLAEVTVAEVRALIDAGGVSS